MESDPQSRDDPAAEIARLRQELNAAREQLAHSGPKTADAASMTGVADRQAQAALEASERRFRDISEAAGEFIWEVDADGLYTYANQACRTLLGYPQEEVVGKLHFYDLHPEQGREEFRLKAFAVFARKEPFTNFLNQVVAKDGRVLDVLTNGVPIIGHQGRLLGYRGSDRDVTELRRAEQALAEEAARRRTLFEQSRDGIVVLDDNGKVYEANQRFADMLGYSAGELASLHVWDWDTRWTREELQEMIRRLDSAGDHFETRHRRPDGTCYDVEISTSATLWAGEKLVLCICRDITDRKQAEEARRQLESQFLHAQKLESLGVLAGGIAHDFNNILASIRAYADLVLAELPSSASARPHVEEIRIATRRAAELTRQILTYTGKGYFRPEPLDLSQVVEDVKRMLEVTVSKKATLEYRLAADLSTIQADASQILQVVLNLVANASEALGENSGRVSLATFSHQLDADLPVDNAFGNRLARGVYVCLEVSDTGCGMDPTTLQRIFDPFFTTKFAGRGLGLAAVQGIVRAHRGAILVSSVVDRGSTFRVLFPASGHAPLPAKGDVPPVGRLTGAGTVLVVDDEEAVRKSTRMLLRSAGFEVLTARDGQEAIDVYRKHQDQVVCVVLDLTMPKMSGEEVFDELQRIAPHLRVILTSGYTEEDMAQRFAHRQVFGFVQKPDPIEPVIARLQELLASRGDAAG